MRAPSSDLPLVLDGVSLRAGATVILDRLNLTITPGAPTLIVGPNGAGKTTLLRLFMGSRRRRAAASAGAAGPTASRCAARFYFNAR